MTYFTSDDVISYLSVYTCKYAIFFVTLFVLIQFLFFSWKQLDVHNIQNNTSCFFDMKTWLNMRKQVVLADLLFMRIQPSFRDRRFYIMDTRCIVLYAI